MRCVDVVWWCYCMCLSVYSCSFWYADWVRSKLPWRKSSHHPQGIGHYHSICHQQGTVFTFPCSTYIIFVWNRESCMLKVFPHWGIYFSEDGARWVATKSKAAYSCLTTGKLKANSVMLKGLLTFSVYPLSIKLFLILIICVTVIFFSPFPVSLCLTGKSELFSHGLHPWHSRVGCVIHPGHSDLDVDWRWWGRNQRVRVRVCADFLAKVTTDHHIWLLQEPAAVIWLLLLLQFYCPFKLCICLCSIGADDFLVIHTRDDCAALHGTTPYTHSSLGTPINMPWLGGAQTGRGASVVSFTTGIGWRR